MFEVWKIEQENMTPIELSGSIKVVLLLLAGILSVLILLILAAWWMAHRRM